MEITRDQELLSPTVLSDDLAGTAQKDFQEVVLDAGKLDYLTTAPHVSSITVHLNIPDSDKSHERVIPIEVAYDARRREFEQLVREG